MIKSQNGKNNLLNLYLKSANELLDLL